MFPENRSGRSRLRNSRRARARIGYPRATDEPGEHPDRLRRGATPSTSRSSSTRAELSYAAARRSQRPSRRPAARARIQRRATASGSCSRTSRYFPVCYYGVLRAGGVVVPMNVLLKRREVAFYSHDSGAKLLFAWHGFARGRRSRAPRTRAPSASSSKPGEFEQTCRRGEPITRSSSATTTTRR